MNSYLSYKNHSGVNILNINLELITQNWSLNSVDGNPIYDNIETICKSIIDKPSPLQNKKINNELLGVDRETLNEIM